MQYWQWTSSGPIFWLLIIFYKLRLNVSLMNSLRITWTNMNYFMVISFFSSNSKIILQKFLGADFPHFLNKLFSTHALFIYVPAEQNNYRKDIFHPTRKKVVEFLKNMDVQKVKTLMLTVATQNLFPFMSMIGYNIILLK